jgi:type IV secretion system protein VirB9
MKRNALLFVLVLSAGSMLAQSTLSSVASRRGAVVLKRTRVPAAAVPSPEAYPFDTIQQKLQTGTHTDSPQAAQPLAVAGATDDEVPASFVPRTDVSLTPTASDAVALAKKLVNERNTPAPSSDGRVVYTYGVGLPTVVCAPLRVCSLELQAGEKIAGEPQIGDTVRWEVTPATAGTDDNMVPILVIKPKMSGLDTTMIVTTDKRTYYVRLMSKPEEFIARTSFTYSDDEHVQWKVFLAEQDKQREEHRAATRIAPTATGAIDKLYFGYEIKAGKGAAGIRPDRVMDDGEKTYIQMPETALHRELPALVIQGPTGNEMVNYRVKDRTYVVDRLFDRAALLMGSGKRQEIVRLVRQQPISEEKK